MNAAHLLRLTLGIFLLATCSLAQVNWSQIAATGAPPAFGGCAWDSLRNRLVAFGGEQAPSLFDTTTEWNGASWQTINPAVRPTARRRPAMAFDAARGVAVLFGGGVASGGFSNETWTWNGTTWTPVPLTTMPSPRFGAAMAYDSVRQVVVLFGGFVPSGQDIGDVWEWNGTAWTPRLFAGPAPLARGAHRMVFDAARGVTVLYGGYGTPAQSTLSDTWTWNGTAWTQGAFGPGSLCDQVMAYDAARQRVVLFGGLRILTLVLTDLNQTWEWNGSVWTLRATFATPVARNSTANGFDPLGNRIVFGGGTNAAGTQYADSWTLQPTTPGSVASYGAGCASSAGTVELNALSLPYIGSPFVHEIANAPASSFAGIVIFGLSNTSWNGTPLPFDLLPFGAPGCFVLASVDVSFATLLIGGQGTVTWNIPNQLALVAAQFFTQAVVLDPLSPLPFQIGVSSGRQCVIGTP